MSAAQWFRCCDSESPSPDHRPAHHVTGCRRRRRAAKQRVQEGRSTSLVSGASRQLKANHRSRPHVAQCRQKRMTLQGQVAVDGDTLVGTSCRGQEILAVLSIPP